MTDKRIIELYNKMVDAYHDYRACIKYPRKSPMAKTMVKYINHMFGEFGYKASSESEMTHGYWLHSTYTGTKVTVKCKNKQVFEFSNTFGDSNAAIAKFILDLHEKHLPGFERNMKINSILDD